MKIGVLNYKYAIATSVSGPADIFAALMRTYPVVTGKDLDIAFSIDFISERKGVFCRMPFAGKDYQALGKNDVYDLLIVPAMSSNRIEEVVRGQARMIEWLKQQYKAGTELASICVGSFLLAATGLLDGRRATTNWLFADMFRKHYPRVILEDDKVIVDQGKIYTCGGAFSFTTFMIYLIEKFCGHDVAITASKILMINVHQQPQTSFSIFQFQTNHADEAIARVQQYMEKNYNKSITMTQMAGISSMSPRNLIRRFEQATSNTPLEYLQRFRIENAKKMLENRNDGIEQVAMKCGYEDMSFFRKVFKRHVGMTPSEYKEKYGRGSLRSRGLSSR
jgi:transcriptional regulator GlxA family with amidase domain